jgi:hypothetical protein
MGLPTPMMIPSCPCISLSNLLQNLLPPMVFAYLLGKRDPFICSCIEHLIWRYSSSPCNFSSMLKMINR